MATGVAVKLMLQCVYSGSLSQFDMEIERRPYHKNCSCALHNPINGVKKKSSSSTAACVHRHKNNNISFPPRKLLESVKSTNNRSMSIISASKFSSPSSLN